jgi:glucuronoarabinoxylan endo-1,4-beta-xylanase
LLEAFDDDDDVLSSPASIRNLLGERSEVPLSVKHLIPVPVLLLAFAACSESAENPGAGGTNGSGATAGQVGSGGTPSSGGAGGTTGGSAGTVGTTGGGAGLSSTGGAGGTGGSAGTVGTTGGSAGVGTGGVSPAGGAPGTGGASTGGASTGGAGGAPLGGMGGAAAGGTAGQGGSSPLSGINVELDKTRQPIQGFGINTALMPSGSLPYADLFGTEGANAIGLSILRVGMNSNGSLTGQGISEARSRGAKIIGSTWSPPANCKSNNSTQNGGALLESCYDSWATTIANFAEQQDLYAMSIANESDFASCPGVPVCTVAYDTTVFTAKQMVAWVKVAGAKLKAKGIKVIAPEASEWVHVWSNASGTGSEVASHPHSSDPLKCGCFANELTNEGCAQTCLDGNGYDYGHWLWKDQDAWNSFDIMGVHEYDSQIAFPWPADVNDGVRNKEVWQTEMSGVKHWPEQGPSIDINNGVAVAGWIHSAMTVGEASAWLYWWYEAYYENDNEGLALTQGSSTIAKRYFTMGNYSKFVRPGYVAVTVSGNDSADVLLSGYKSADGATVVVVAINKGSAAASPKIGFAGGTAPASCTPHVTSASDNLKAGTAVAVADGALTASLASKTVTTYVCQ